MFKAKKEPYGRALFCSRECFKADAGIKNPTKRLNTEVNALHRIASRESKPFLSMIVLKEMAGLSRIHKAHYKTFYEKTLIFGYKGTKLKIFCEQCSKPFVYQMGQGGLKRKCDNCIKENKRTISRIAKGVRRAKQRLVSYQSIDPIKVFEQDKWKCHICGIYTPKELRGTHLDQAPELDHIITIADGGSHTYGNVACACRSCNQKKGATSCGQLKFF
jgi:5-methylcytosine-specific restriction endonuclease McrA